MSGFVTLDVRISSYLEEPARIVAEFDVANEELIISDILPFAVPKNPYKNKTPEEVEIIKQLLKQSIVVVDNILSFPNWDLNFKEREHLNETVLAYFEFSRIQKLVLDPKIKSRYNMNDVIVSRTLDAVRGNVYELNPEETTNSHVAILVACWAALKARGGAAIISQEEGEITDEHRDSFLVPFSF